MRPSAADPSVGKRKFLSDSNAPNRKKRRSADPQPQPQSSTTSPYHEVYKPLLAKLDSRFQVKTMSVMPSTSISKHVDRALEHLGRFSAWDQTVFPGVVLLCAKSAASSKLITISELVRRRIAEADQKWFQYNILSETMWEEASQPTEDPSVVEDTFMAVDRDDEEDADDEYFEPIRPTIHEQAVRSPKVRYKAHMVVLLSRVRLDELRGGKNISLQTNEQHIEYQRKKSMGLVG
ncbi:DNA/RNA-binding protein Alba-like domain-containing protein [Madurella fahalii]|uniref:DNA/RNA-binding protein Alba-like domain-containing protein n=1 Tax=Madurella fahalii TaxID=1157608 RepID=A0ABQ0GEP4_9PEZI